MSTPHVLEFWSTRKNNADPSTYVGNFQRLFYNPQTKSIRISDGFTPGGLPITGGDTSPTVIYSETEPVASPNGLMWFNPSVDILYIASNNVWVEVGGSGGQGAVALYSVSPPTPSPNGLLWYNPITSELSIADNGVWVLFSGSSGIGATGATGPVGATGLVVAYIFDGGSPDTNYEVGPAFDCGGVI